MVLLAPILAAAVYQQCKRVSKVEVELPPSESPGNRTWPYENPDQHPIAINLGEEVKDGSQVSFKLHTA